ncbi:MAG: class II glutamine amidotransferase, partial [Geminicoccaceae bacterium]
MCGIFCLMLDRAGRGDLPRIRNALTRLLKLAERRGREASGLAGLTPGGTVVIKQPTSASDLIRSAIFEDFMQAIDTQLQRPDGEGGGPVAFLGHARLVTNGKRAIHNNNQPFQTGRFVGVHNGIIVNADALHAELDPAVPPPELDSLCIGEMIERLIRDGRTPEAANREVLDRFDGIASYLLLDTEAPAVLAATNNGSLHQGEILEGGRLLLSEQAMLAEFNAGASGFSLDPASFKSLGADSALHWRLAPEAEKTVRKSSNRPRVVDLSGMKRPGDVALKRCTRCVLPET